MAIKFHGLIPTGPHIFAVRCKGITYKHTNRKRWIRLGGLHCGDDGGVEPSAVTEAPRDVDTVGATMKAPELPPFPPPRWREIRWRAPARACLGRARSRSRLGHQASGGTATVMDGWQQQAVVRRAPSGYAGGEKRWNSNGITQVLYRGRPRRTPTP